MKILTICPTIHPEKFQSMQESFYLTSSRANTLWAVSEGTVTEAFNNTFNNNLDYDFYFMANDDIEFITPGWDLQLANEGKISWGKDGLQDQGICTFPMIDGDIVRKLGWLQMPKLNRYCGDMVWYFIGKQCGILNYYKDVIIDHKWDGCSHPDINKEDMRIFSEWLPLSYRDINKVRGVLNGIS